MRFRHVDETVSSETVHGDIRFVDTGVIYSAHCHTSRSWWLSLNLKIKASLCNGTGFSNKFEYVNREFLFYPRGLHEIEAGNE